MTSPPPRARLAESHVPTFYIKMKRLRFVSVNILSPVRNTVRSQVAKASEKFSFLMIPARAGIVLAAGGNDELCIHAGRVN